MGFLGQLFSAQNQYQQTAPTNNYQQAQNAALGQPNQTLSQEQQLAQALQQQMQGGGPNLAQTQLQAATDRANQQAAGMVGATQGLNPSTAARQILNQQAQNSQAAANQSAQLRQQQQLAAQQQLGGVLANQGQLGLGQVSTLGNLQNQQNQLNLQSQLANQGAANSFFGTGQSGSNIAGGIGQGISNIGDLLFSEGGMVHDFTDGGSVPGEAEVDGDSAKNDTVPAMLSPGEVVIPRTLVKQASLDPQKVSDFVSAFSGSPKASGYGRVLQAKRKASSFNE